MMMVATLNREREVARNDISVKLDAHVAKKAKLVATNRGITLAEYISEILRPIVDRDLKHEMGKMLSEGSSPKGKAGQK
jgi:hypothetical protein